MYGFVCTRECSCPKRLENAVDSLETRVIGGLCHLTWVLGARLGSCGRTVDGIDCGAFSPSPYWGFQLKPGRVFSCPSEEKPKYIKLCFVFLQRLENHQVVAKCEWWPVSQNDPE